ncbi:hypothetical protein HYX09_05100 [Candidatus Woesearchaeota archaeon]|nr:hypothetical protein [Candidatus Woesearchaeota archaeon]
MTPESTHILDQVLASSDGNPNSYVAAALIFFRTNQFQQAVDELELAEKLAGKGQLSGVNGVSYSELRRVIYSGFARVLYQKAMVLPDLDGHVQQADEIVARHLNGEPTEEWDCIDAAIRFIRIKQYGEAARVVESLDNLFPAYINPAKANELKAIGYFVRATAYAGMSNNYNSHAHAKSQGEPDLDGFEAASQEYLRKSMIFFQLAREQLGDAGIETARRLVAGATIEKPATAPAKEFKFDPN